MAATGMRIHNEKEVTRDDVLREAKDIWKKCQTAIKRRNLKFGDKDGAEKLMSEFRKEHKEFSTSYPIVLRYMAEMQTFHPDALRLYLKKIEEHPWKSETEYLDSQADYVTLLYKATHSRYNTTEVARVRENIRKILVVEHEKFKLYQEEFSKEVNEMESRLEEMNKHELAAYFKKIGKGETVEEPAEDADTSATTETNTTTDTIADTVEQSTNLDEDIDAILDGRNYDITNE